MFHKVTNVQPIPDYVLLVKFENGERRKYDVKPLLGKWEPFRALTEIEGLFDLVKVDAGGYGVAWNDDLDLACDELYHNGAPVAETGGGLHA